jgi:SAM-dependent methyltransferase
MMFCPGPAFVICMPHQNEARIARDFWIEHSRDHVGTQAVHPRGAWSGYHAWTRRMLQDWTIERVKDAAPRYRRCIDLGCGIGDWTERFAELADEVHACDLSPDFVEQTRMRVPAAIVQCADLRDYKFPRRSDLVYVGAVLTYLPDADVLDVLRRIRAATVPGALVLVRDYCAFNLGRRTVNQSAAFYSVHRRAGDLCQLAELAGLTCVELRSSPSIYGEVMTRRAPLLQWPMRALWRLATASWMRASHTLILRA